MASIGISWTSGSHLCLVVRVASSAISTGMGKSYGIVIPTSALAVVNVGTPTLAHLSRQRPICVRFLVDPSLAYVLGAPGSFAMLSSPLIERPRRQHENKAKKKRNELTEDDAADLDCIEREGCLQLLRDKPASSRQLSRT